MEDNKKLSLQFTGNGGDLFIIYLINALLIPFTLGIYFFWGSVKIKKYFHENLEFLGGRFGYHATGKERFFGFLKAVAMVIVLGAAMFVLMKLLSFIVGEKAAAIIMMIFLYGGLIILIPVIQVGTLRYNLSRTSWKEYRFRFTGRPSDMLVIYIKGLVLTAITLGIYAPWFICSLSAFIMGNTKIGNESFEYTGNGKDLLFKVVKGILLSIITLGIYVPWYIADIERYNWEHTLFQGKPFKSDMTGGQLFAAMLISTILVMFTFGIGFAWAVVRIRKVYLDSLSITAEPDITGLVNIDDKDASATTSGVEDLGSLLDTLADFIG